MNESGNESGQQRQPRSSTDRAAGFEPANLGSTPSGAAIQWGKVWEGVCKLVVMMFIVGLLSRWINHMGAVELELKRINNMLELQYHEMQWTDETFDDYCEENPEGCEITQ